MEVVTYKQNAQIAIIKYTSEFFKPKSYKKYDGSELIGNNGIPPPSFQKCALRRISNESHIS